MKWLAIFLLTATAAAQTGPAFDVISVKLAAKNDGTMATRPTLTARRMTWQTDLYYLNSFAWNIPIDRISGVHGDPIVQIEATTNHDATADEMRQMTRTLLATRFKQQARLVSKDVDGAALTLTKGGLKVKQSQLPENDRSYVVGTIPENGITLVTSHYGTIDQLAQNLALFLHQPVWNRTGVTGNYEYKFRYAMDDDPSIDAPSLENALRDQLGVNLLKKQNGPVEYLVIDSMESNPGAN
ncbi:MAG TPA: TIGR03435 family protein [Bryobacteraceae bacterium]|nr:TIGR03435 family protein [Bryobacteraceae bacterium]